MDKSEQIKEIMRISQLAHGTRNPCNERPGSPLHSGLLSRLLCTAQTGISGISLGYSLKLCSLFDQVKHSILGNRSNDCHLRLMIGSECHPPGAVTVRHGIFVHVFSGRICQQAVNRSQRGAIFVNWFGAFSHNYERPYMKLDYRSYRDTGGNHDIASKSLRLISKSPIASRPTRSWYNPIGTNRDNVPISTSSTNTYPATRFASRIPPGRSSYIGISNFRCIFSNIHPNYIKPPTNQPTIRTVDYFHPRRFF